jgi:hypothetical protein
MYSLRFLPLVIVMRGVTDAALLIDIIQLGFFAVQASSFNKIALVMKFVRLILVSGNLISGGINAFC